MRLHLVQSNHKKCLLVRSHTCGHTQKHICVLVCPFSTQRWALASHGPIARPPGPQLLTGPPSVRRPCDSLAEFIGFRQVDQNSSFEGRGSRPMLAVVPPHTVNRTIGGPGRPGQPTTKEGRKEGPTDDKASRADPRQGSRPGRNLRRSRRAPPPLSL